MAIVKTGITTGGNVQEFFGTDATEATDLATLNANYLTVGIGSNCLMTGSTKNIYLFNGTNWGSF